MTIKEQYLKEDFKWLSELKCKSVQELMHLVSENYDRLGEKCATVIQHRFVGKMTQKEIAKAMGISPEYVSYLKRKAIILLQFKF